MNRQQYVNEKADYINDRINDAKEHLGSALYRLNRRGDIDGFMESLEIVKTILECELVVLKSLPKTDTECPYKGKHSSYLGTYETCDKCGYQG